MVDGKTRRSRTTDSEASASTKRKTVTKKRKKKGKNTEYVSTTSEVAMVSRDGGESPSDDNGLNISSISSKSESENYWMIEKARMQKQLEDKDKQLEDRDRVIKNLKSMANVVNYVGRKFDRKAELKKSESEIKDIVSAYCKNKCYEYIKFADHETAIKALRRALIERKYSIPKCFSENEFLEAHHHLVIRGLAQRRKNTQNQVKKNYEGEWEWKQ